MLWIWINLWWGTNKVHQFYHDEDNVEDEFDDADDVDDDKEYDVGDEDVTKTSNFEARKEF